MEGLEVRSSEAIIDNGSFGHRIIKFETGRLARQAAGSAVVYLDDTTMVLSATTASKRPKENLDFFPLTVDVEERMYSVGRIPGSFFRREGRPSEDAILTCRLIDRPLRPSFTKGLRNEIQVVETIMSLDPDHLYDVVAINAASMSTQLSGIPFSGPIGGVRVALIDGQWIGVPDALRARARGLRHGRRRTRRRARGQPDVAIMMVEAEATEETVNLIAGGAAAPTEEVVAQGLEAAKPFIRALCDAQAELAAVAAKPTREFPLYLDYQDDVLAAVEQAAGSELAAAMTIAGKQEREEETRRIMPTSSPTSSPASSRGARRRSRPPSGRSPRTWSRERILRDQVRIDGRGPSDIRRLSAEVGVVPLSHGSSLFERGETQIMGVTTLNMLRMEQQLDTLNPVSRKRYMHNYNFPPYSTGETGRVDSPKRREIGHGALAERALVAGAARLARSSRTRSVRCLRRSARTVPPRWARCVPRRCRCCTQVSR